MNEKKINKLLELYDKNKLFFVIKNKWLECLKKDDKLKLVDDASKVIFLVAVGIFVLSFTPAAIFQALGVSAKTLPFLFDFLPYLYSRAGLALIASGIVNVGNRLRKEFEIFASLTYAHKANTKGLDTLAEEYRESLEKELGKERKNIKAYSYSKTNNKVNNTVTKKSTLDIPLKMENKDKYEKSFDDVINLISDAEYFGYEEDIERVETIKQNYLLMKKECDKKGIPIPDDIINSYSSIMKQIQNNYQNGVKNSQNSR